jgi:hypothetical protein
LAAGIAIDATTWDHIMASGDQVGLDRGALEALAR